MFIKAQLRDTNKKINLKGIKTYAEFTAKIKNTFSGLNEEITFYYYDSSKDRCEVDNDESFQAYLDEPDKPKIIIKLPDEDFLNQSFFQRSVSRGDSVLLQKLDQEGPIITQVKPETNFKRENKAPDQPQEQNKGSISLKSQKSESAASSTAKQKEQIEEEKMFKKSLNNKKQQEKVSKVVHKNIKCNHCNQQIVGIRWKCLDQFDVDVCNQCYQANIHKAGHTLLKIQTEDYLAKLNYRDSIYKLFNPNYDEGPTNINQPIKPWIKEQDILQSTPEAIKLIWDASQAIARAVAKDFDAWEKQWETKAIKS